MTIQYWHKLLVYQIISKRQKRLLIATSRATKLSTHLPTGGRPSSGRITFRPFPQRNKLWDIDHWTLTSDVLVKSSWSWNEILTSAIDASRGSEKYDVRERDIWRSGSFEIWCHFLLIAQDRPVSLSLRFERISLCSRIVYIHFVWSMESNGF